MTTNPARLRRRLSWILAGGLLLVLPGAVALQLAPDAGARGLWLALLGTGWLIALVAGIMTTRLNLRALGNPELSGELHDELSVRNGVRSMAVGYGAFLLLAGSALPLTFLFELPVLPVLTAVLLLGISSQLAAFAWLERQGDDE